LPDTAGHVQCQKEIETGISICEVGKDIFAVINSDDDSVFGGYGANQAFLILESTVLVFDSGLSMSQARNLDNAIRSVTDKKVRYLINSHDHSDHVFGNSFFKNKYGSKGLVIISHEICRDNILAKGSKRLSSYRKIVGMKKNLENLEVCAPIFSYPDLGFRVEIEGTQLVFSHPPMGAHTLGDTVLYIPAKSLAFTGDVLWNHFLPNLEDANLEGWIDYLQEIDLATYRKFIPGHGEVSDSETVGEFLGYLKSVRENLLKVDLAKISARNATSLSSCFSVNGTENWKLRSIIDHNIDALFLRRKGS